MVLLIGFRSPDLVPSKQFNRDQQVHVHLPVTIAIGMAKNAAPRRWRQIKQPGR
jgi:hypothetical protein